MFEKIIKNSQRFLSEMDREDFTMLAGVIGIIILGFFIYLIWQSRINYPESDADQVFYITDSSSDYR